MPTSETLGFVRLSEEAKAAVAPLAAARAHGGILIPLFSNRGYLPYLRNVICSMQRLAVRKRRWHVMPSRRRWGWGFEAIPHAGATATSSCYGSFSFH